ncbi:MAG: glycosyltransferase family 4 protein [Methanomethylovorans sp.]|uniref:glycosyltransferase family 4 protein n=1 Tax=Methanomethylovorans sp. TaxID=2758717 RepID=UPI003531565B
MSEKVSICFIALGAYPLLTGKDAKNIIGPDVHQVTLAKELVNQGFEVSIIVYGNEFCQIEYIKGIKVIQICNKTHKLRFIDMLLKAFAVCNAMIKSKAHIFYNAGGGSGIISIFSKIIRTKFIYEIASDAQVNRKIIIKKNREFSKSILSLERIGNLVDIKLADKIIVQTLYQKNTLESNFRVDSYLIKMPFQIPRDRIPFKEKPPIVLWVGSMAEVKQPQLFLELAMRFPEQRFQMIGGNSGDQKLYTALEKKSEEILNLDFLGVVPLSEIDKYFRKASLLVNTSMFEGFPNAFIQAWINYTPVVSLHSNPDKILDKFNIGVHSQNFDQLLEDIKMMLNNDKLREKMGINGRKYVENEHNIQNNILKYIKLINGCYKDVE